MSEHPHAADQDGREDAANARRQAAREQMAAAVAELRSAEGWQRWAEVRARFHGYSVHNTLLILAQRRDATLVAGYRRWRELGRQVRKGERGIRIWAPSTRMELDETTGERQRVLRGWVVVSVFDIAQTEGPPLPEPPRPEPLSGDSHAGRLEGLRHAAADLGVAVTIEPLPDSREGYFSRRRSLIVVGSALAPNGQVATLAHELAHANGVSYERYGRQAAEVIAETAAHVALRAAGLDTSASSVPYVAAWSEANSGLLEQCAGAVDDVARRLESALGAGRTLERTLGAESSAGAKQPRDSARPRPDEVGLTYEARRDDAGNATIDVVSSTGRQRLKAAARKSPQLDWGNGGAGARVTARAILQHALGEPPSEKAVRAFVSSVVASANRAGFEIEREAVRDWSVGLAHERTVGHEGGRD